MSTCQTASAADPDDAFLPEDCESVFHFPDSEPLIQAEFEKNIPALAVGDRRRIRPNPVSVVGRTAPDFVLDPFTVSYGTPQTVAVTARRDPEPPAALPDQRGHEEQRDRRGVGGRRALRRRGDVYYAEFRGEVTGASPGDEVEVVHGGPRAPAR